MASLFFTDDVVLMAPLALDLHSSLDWFAVECKLVGRRISTSKPDAMVLSKNLTQCLLQVGNKSLSQLKKFKYLGFFFTSEETKAV